MSLPTRNHSSTSGASSTKRAPPAVVRFAAAVCARAGVSGRAQAQRLCAALELVPRDQFLEERHKLRALEDSRLASGFGQFSPPPYRIVRMLALAGVAPGVTVLELGCGAGYASALMCVLGARLFATEPLGLRAQATRRHLDMLGLNRILIATGHFAWVDSAPFDAIVSHLPIPSEELAGFTQLLDPASGRLIAPNKPDGEGSELLLVEMEQGVARSSIV